MPKRPIKNRKQLKKTKVQYIALVLFLFLIAISFSQLRPYRAPINLFINEGCGRDGRLNNLRWYGFCEWDPNRSYSQVYNLGIPLIYSSVEVNIPKADHYDKTIINDYLTSKIYSEKNKINVIALSFNMLVWTCVFLIPFGLLYRHMFGGYNFPKDTR